MFAREWFKPNCSLPSAGRYLVIAVWGFAVLAAWNFGRDSILPKPGEIFRALPHLWTEKGLGQELWLSLVLNLEAISVLTLLSFALAYISVVPFFKPLVRAFTLGRFNGFVGIPLIFTLWLGNPHYVKVALLVFGAGVFTVPSLVDAIAAIPKAEFDHARTLRFSEWRVLWEVIVLGQFDVFLKVLRTNMAMVWMLVPMVEVLFRYEGGIGSLMFDLNRHMELAYVYGATLVVFAVGFAQDAVAGLITSVACPYASIGLESR